MINKDAYLRCEYSPGPFSNERVIGFKNLKGLPSFCFVRAEDVIPLDNEYGLVKLTGLTPYEGGVFAHVIDVGDHRISRFLVPKSEIVLRESTS
tara:strand:+ start:204 stop:485 length:282 start_codon:yes stop_codon:yes gene_type:complete